MNSTFLMDYGPVQRMKASEEIESYRRKWRNRALVGVTLVGLGINFLGEAIIAKGNPPPDAGFAHMAYWFWIGLFGIAAVNGGICCLADAAKQRLWMEFTVRGRTDSATKKD